MSGEFPDARFEDFRTRDKGARTFLPLPGAEVAGGHRVQDDLRVMRWVERWIAPCALERESGNVSAPGRARRAEESCRLSLGDGALRCAAAQPEGCNGQAGGEKHGDAA
jgi:hypothetical protein